MYWKIEPYHSNDADFCIMPADTEEDRQGALQYAQDQIEAVWDQLKPGQKGTVTIELCEGEVPELDI